MADAPINMLDREAAIKDKLTPTGRKLGVVLEQDVALFRVEYTDGKGGALPGELTGKWTKAEWAAENIQRYLKQMWDMSDLETQKLARRNHRDKVIEKETNGQLESETTAT